MFNSAYCRVPCANIVPKAPGSLQHRQQETSLSGEELNSRELFYTSYSLPIFFVPYISPLFLSFLPPHLAVALLVQVRVPYGRPTLPLGCFPRTIRTTCRRQAARPDWQILANALDHSQDRRCSWSSVGTAPPGTVAIAVIQLPTLQPTVQIGSMRLAILDPAIIHHRDRLFRKVQFESSMRPPSSDLRHNERWPNNWCWLRLR